MDLKRRIILAIILLIPLILVLNFVPYPRSWEEASDFQIITLFISLLLAATFLFNIFFNYLPRSFIAALGVVVMLVLQAIGLLNYVSGGVLVIVILAVIRFFPKIKLLQPTKIPKLKRLGKSKNH